ncbi:apical junction molecule-like [Ctenocephalides felis]|uniref:apical junction molecule-like n=1 Tax=Ctenocephalides felis TaxID=7515 RepID=UPI000E6E532B|nr:apical junction molecule-like [Ctenocephalides felis]
MPRRRRGNIGRRARHASQQQAYSRNLSEERQNLIRENARLRQRVSTQIRSLASYNRLAFQYDPTANYVITEIMAPRKSIINRDAREARRAKRRRLNMTEEQRAADREKRRLRHVQKRKAETPEQREARLEIERMRQRKSRIAKQQILRHEKRKAEIQKFVEEELAKRKPRSRQTINKHLLALLPIQYLQKKQEIDNYEITEICPKNEEICLQRFLESEIRIDEQIKQEPVVEHVDVASSRNPTEICPENEEICLQRFLESEITIDEQIKQELIDEQDVATSTNQTSEVVLMNAFVHLITEIMAPRKSIINRDAREARRAKRRRLNMTEEERAADREKRRLRHIQKRKAETPEQREARLEIERMRQRKSRIAKQQILRHEKRKAEIQKFVEEELAKRKPRSRQTINKHLLAMLPIQYPQKKQEIDNYEITEICPKNEEICLQRFLESEIRINEQIKQEPVDEQDMASSTNRTEICPENEEICLQRFLESEITIDEQIKQELIDEQDVATSTNQTSEVVLMNAFVHCRSCNTIKSTLNRHERIHTGPYPYICETCKRKQ